MRRTFVTLLVIIFSISYVFGQNYRGDGNKAFKDKDYLTASINWIEFLHAAKKPGKNYNFKCDLSTSLVEAEPYSLGKINELERVSGEFIGDRTVFEREHIVNTYDSLAMLERRFNALPQDAYKTKKCPMLSFSVGDYSADRDAAEERVIVAKQKAAELHYNEALKRLEMGGLENARAAYREFERAEFFGADYQDLQSKKEEAHQAGIKKIIIVPLANNSNYPYAHSMGEEVRQLTQNKLMGDARTGYWVEFVQPEALALKMGVSVAYLNVHVNNAQAAIAARDLGIHEIWAGDISAVTTPNPEVSVDNEEGTARIKVGERKVIKDNGKEKTENVYEDQKYYYREYTKTVSGQLRGVFKVLTVEDNRVSPTQNFTESFRDETTWNVYRGGSQKAWNKSNKASTEQPLAAPNERVRIMLTKAADRLYKQIAAREARVLIPVIKTTAEATR